jgi:hypothetical protein
MTNLLHIFVPCASQLQILSLKFLVDNLSKDWSMSMPNLEIHHWNKNFLTYPNCFVFINIMVWFVCWLICLLVWYDLIELFYENLVNSYRLVYNWYASEPIWALNLASDQVRKFVHKVTSPMTTTIRIPPYSKCSTILQTFFSDRT